MWEPGYCALATVRSAARCAAGVDSSGSGRSSQASTAASAVWGPRSSQALPLGQEAAPGRSARAPAPCLPAHAAGRGPRPGRPRPVGALPGRARRPARRARFRPPARAAAGRRCASARRSSAAASSVGPVSCPDAAARATDRRSRLNLTGGAEARCDGLPVLGARPSTHAETRVALAEAKNSPPSSGGMALRPRRPTWYAPTCRLVRLLFVPWRAGRLDPASSGEATWLDAREGGRERVVAGRSSRSTWP